MDFSIVTYRGSLFRCGVHALIYYPDARIDAFRINKTTFELTAIDVSFITCSGSYCRPCSLLAGLYVTVGESKQQFTRNTDLIYRSDPYISK